MFGSVGGRGRNKERGGNGGGVLWMNVTGEIFVDGVVTANGENGVAEGSGGGSGGSVWMYCKTIKGYGKISANGGSGSMSRSYPGGGGAGGRIAIYFQENVTSPYFIYEARGGAAFGCEFGKEREKCKAEAGGPGTVFLYHMIHDHRTLLIHNGHQQPLESAIDDYSDLSRDGCRAWLLPQSGSHHFARGKHDFHFEELQIYGGGHLAVLTDPVGRNTSLYFEHTIGDRTGTIHVSTKQVMNLFRPEVDLPFNVRVYKDGFLGLAPYTEVHGIQLYNEGVLAHIHNITLHHGGVLWMYQKGRTAQQPYNSYSFDSVRIQDKGFVWALPSPVGEFGISIKCRSLYVEGGGLLQSTHLSLHSINITVDDGGVIDVSGRGYNVTHPRGSGGVINQGIGLNSTSGSSGAGHGGRGGSGEVQVLTSKC